MGQTDERITPHSLYLALGKDETERLAKYHGLFWMMQRLPIFGLH
ncbi:MAG: hypothetical protein WAO71_00710 [Gallionella sp.]